MTSLLSCMVTVVLIGNSRLVSDSVSGSQLHSQSHIEGPIQCTQISHSKYIFLLKFFCVLWLFNKPRSYDLQTRNQSRQGGGTIVHWCYCSDSTPAWQQGHVASILNTIQIYNNSQSLVLMGLSGSTLCFSDSGRYAQKSVGFGRCLDQQWAGSYLIKASMLPLSRSGQTTVTWMAGIGRNPLKSCRGTVGFWARTAVWCIEWQ